MGADPTQPDAYAILGVAPGADDEAIRRAHRQLAQRLHPDVSGGHPRAEERYRVLAEALATLRDPKARATVDDARARAAEATRGVRGNMRGMVSSFAAALHPAPDGPPPSRGAEHVVRLRLDFVAATRGGDRTVELPLRVECLECGGTGGLPLPEPTPCHVCEGRGGFHEPRVRGGPRWHPCPMCRGRGRLHPRLCPACDATGLVTRRQTLRLRVPPGTDSQSTLRLPGRGAPGQNGGTPGDLVVRVEVAAHPLFRRAEHDLHVDVPLSLAEATAGASLPVPTLEGPVAVDIAPGAGFGDVLRLRGRGVPRDDGPPGDLYLHVRVEPPVALDGPQREALDAFERLATRTTYPRRAAYRAHPDVRGGAADAEESDADSGG